MNWTSTAVAEAMHWHGEHARKGSGQMTLDHLRFQLTVEADALARINGRDAVAVEDVRAACDAIDKANRGW